MTAIRNLRAFVESLPSLPTTDLLTLWMRGGVEVHPRKEGRSAEELIALGGIFELPHGLDDDRVSQEAREALRAEINRRIPTRAP